MKDEKSKEMKRIKLLRIGFVVSVILVLLSVWQLIFESADNFRKVIYWIVFIFWTAAAIINWFEFKKAKEKFQENLP